MLEILKSKELGASEKVIVMFMGLNGNGVYTYQDFMDSTGLSRATVGRSLSKLYDDGWIDKKTTISPSGAESIEYALLLQKASVAERLNRPCFVYVQRLTGPGLTVGKVGIAFNVFERMRQQGKSSLFRHELVYSRLFECYTDASNMEKQVLRELPQFVCEKDWLPDGYTETIHVDDILHAIKIIEEKQK